MDTSHLISSIATQINDFIVKNISLLSAEKKIHKTYINRKDFFIDDITSYIKEFGAMDIKFTKDGKSGMVLFTLIDGTLLKFDVVDSRLGLFFRKNWIKKLKYASYLNGNTTYIDSVKVLTFKSLESNSAYDITKYVRDAINDYEFYHDVQEYLPFDYAALESHLNAFLDINKRKPITIKAFIHHHKRVLSLISKELFSSKIHNTAFLYDKRSSLADTSRRQANFSKANFIELPENAEILNTCEECEKKVDITCIIDGKAICSSCRRRHSKKSKKQNGFVTADGRVLYGADKTREINYLKNLERKDKLLKEDKIFKCTKCKKYVNIKHKSKNSNICNACFSFKISISNTKAISTKKLIENSENMSYAEKMQRQEEEQKMIADFLQKKQITRS